MITKEKIKDIMESNAPLTKEMKRSRKRAMFLFRLFGILYAVGAAFLADDYGVYSIGEFLSLWLFLVLPLFLIGAIVSLVDTHLLVKREILDNTYRTALLTELMADAQAFDTEENTQTGENPIRNRGRGATEAKEIASVDPIKTADGKITCPICKMEQAEDRACCFYCGTPFNK